jgi:heme-degrading monooxygenase HmoA
MHARMTTLTVPSEQQGGAVQSYSDTIKLFREIPGNRGAFLLVDQDGGRGVGVTLWESDQAMAESRERANELRQQAATSASGEIVSVDEYEVAVWEVDAE